MLDSAESLPTKTPEHNDNHVGSRTDDIRTAKSANAAKLHKLHRKKLITLSYAQDEEEDMRVELKYTQRTAMLYEELYHRKEEIKELVAFHCGLTPDMVQTRIVQTYQYPSYEASEYLVDLVNSFLDHGYILMDWIGDDDVQMLSTTFSQPHTDIQIVNLYRSMSKIMLSLAKTPQPRIGTWTVDNYGRISLTNRPIFCHLHQLENWSIPTTPQTTTYTSADSFYFDLLEGHDNRLRYQANAATNESDARGQATDLVLMRALLHRFTDRHLRDGPFFMQLTDMHNSNILVDQKWNIKHVIDLELACSLPIGCLLPPFWLTGQSVDRLKDAEYERFRVEYERFVDIFEREEQNMKTPLHYSPSACMKTALISGRYWYFNALQTPKGLFNLFRQHLRSRFDKTPLPVVCEGVSAFWTRGMTTFVQ
ncbi:predicted protein [Uncinocarpus reesii 1704]|uniref:Aminoglycoside phosphotransferase domain-containing protein n=1 Tax=Uncinocarpus reesii (strain UAMH 1704) TaxID=336963 RepID=C4JKQ7_UNCRE|nr:uncharacterized protein UREG_00655 [Uncinocarpus reesii 1704]EEP75808.1 predicted protein [Uncinocarpus reesii 1704]